MITRITAIFVFLLCFTCLLAARPAYAATYYVDGVIGLDTNAGSSSLPWKTLQKAGDTLVAGDTVNIKGGITYTGNTACPSSAGERVVMCIKNSGSSGNPITIQAWPGTGTPVIDTAGGPSSGIGFMGFYRDYYVISGLHLTNSTNNPGAGDNMGLITLSFANNHITIKNNIFTHHWSGLTIFGSSDINVFNNTFDGCDLDSDSAAVTVYFGSSITSTNNISTNNYLAINVINSTSSVDYNLYYGNTTNFSGISAGSHDLLSDPLYVSSSNFRLTSSSPAVNSGSTLAAVTQDIIGISRPHGSAYDMGAYEYYSPSISLNALSPDPGTNTQPSFSGTSATDVGSSITQIYYSLDSGGWSTLGVTGTATFSVQIPVALSNGSHTIQVRAEDSLGTITGPSNYASDTFVVDTAPPTAPRLKYPSGYSNQYYQPLLVFAKSTDNTTSVDHYDIFLDPGKQQQYSLLLLPGVGNGTQNFIWRDNELVRVEYLNENDSDIANDEIRVYFKGLNSQSLTDGKHVWKVIATDTVGNQSSTTADFDLDKTTPEFDNIGLSGIFTSLSFAQPYFLPQKANRNLIFTGQVKDSYIGSQNTSSDKTDYFGAVSSGPAKIYLDIYRLNTRSLQYGLVSTQTLDLQTSRDNHDSKSTSFRFMLASSIDNGIYQFRFSLADNAQNIRNYPPLYISTSAPPSYSKAIFACLNSSIVSACQNPSLRYFLGKLPPKS